MDGPGPSNGTKIRNDLCARGSILPPSDQVARHVGSYGWLHQEEKQLEKLDLHARLCPFRPSSLPATHFSLHELICPDSCQISPLTPGPRVGTATDLSFPSPLLV